MNKRAGFTLVELITVIAVVGALAVAVVLILNPAELMKKAKDVTRLSDLDTLNKSINLFQVNNIDALIGSLNTVYVSLPDLALSGNATSSCEGVSPALPNLPLGWFYRCVSPENLRKTDGTGWIPINFGASQDAPLAVLPVDPENKSENGLYYNYVIGGSWKLTALFQSESLAKAAINDNGVDPGVFEVGTNLSLAPFSRGLIGYWPLDEENWGMPDCNTLVVLDASGNNNNGKSCPVGTGPQGGAAGKIGRAGDFNRATYYLDMGNPALFSSLSQISISFWINNNTSPTSVGGNWYFPLTKATEPDNGFGFFYSNPSTLIFWVHSYSEQNVAALSLPEANWVNNWNYVVGVYDGQRIRIYVNGEEGGASTFWPDLNFNSASYLSIGRPSFTGHGVDARIDDVRIYSTALSSVEIKSLYNATK